MSAQSKLRRGTPAVFYEDEFVTLYCGDCRDVGADLGRADVLITDPPFNVGKDYGASDDSLPTEEYSALMRYLADNGPETQAWVTPTNRLTLFSEALGHDARPVVVRRGAQGPKRWGWYDQFDLLLVRGRPTRWESNLWDGIRLKGEGYFFREEHYDHPGYTPYALTSKLVGLMATPGQTIFEPFAGTGTTLVAAKSLGCKAVGVELDERWCRIAAQRLGQGVLHAA